MAGYWDRMRARDEMYARQEEERSRGKSIGDTIDFVRYGSVPSGGRSTNYRDGITECGVSVYLVDGDEVVLVGWYFEIITRDEYRGRGTIVGWGSDGEPLVEILAIEKMESSSNI